MFVLPPPPKFPVGSPAYVAALSQMRDNNLDTHNTLKFPTGEEYVFTTGEGQYTLRDDIHLATPPPHPSEVPILNPNPLSTAPVPITAGVKLSLCCIKYRNNSIPGMYPVSTNQLSVAETRSSLGSTADYDDTASDKMSTSGTSKMSGAMPSSYASQSQFGMYIDSENNANVTALSAVLANAVASPPSSAKDSKKRKPKNNMAKSNSSFVSRITPHEHLAKRLSERHSEDLYYFANINRSFNWMDYASPTVKHEPLSKVLFTKAHPICHDVNQLTRSSQHIDVAMGFSSSDIIWYDPMSTRYNRLNKNGAINNSACIDIQWIPGSENLMMAGHMDGSIVIYDKEKDDSNFLEDLNGIAPDAERKDSRDGFQVMKSIHGNQRAQKQNPVAYWNVSRKPITAFAFSPDCTHVAVVSEDGYLKIIDFLKERLVDVFSSYYGGLLCVCWSPDGRYILTGGQDDLVSIWSFSSRSLVARCQGHQSFVRSVAFDPWRCDERVYRFGSVGDDCRLLLWDFSVKSLHRPRGTAHRGSVSSRYSTTSKNTHDLQSLRSGRTRSDSNAVAVEDEDIHHPTAPKASIPIIPPVMSKQVDPDPLSSIHFREDCLIITCHSGHIRTWNRPTVHSTEGVVDK
ncbi:WD40-repeat-containing domain protein [Kockiozyma suomiensis]|uniref:WD40-repeat-containing domain protein n=1 Tax=Kockiozyma suomiensis TaxID=1337062 RepID=UPI003343AB77